MLRKPEITFRFSRPLAGTISVALSAAMLATALPTNVPYGIVNAKAAGRPDPDAALYHTETPEILTSADADDAISPADDDVFAPKTVAMEKDGRNWYFSAWGTSTSVTADKLNDISRSGNGYLENEDGSVRLWSVDGKGKFVPASTDGLAFYYTAVDPEKENFELTADIHVNKWTLSNGQDGFGMMVSDAVGRLGSGATFWNNSYQLLATRTQYVWDTVNRRITTGADSTFVKYTMNLGIGWFSKEGVTQTDLTNITDGTSSMPENFMSQSGSLETFVGEQNSISAIPSGTYNIIGNAVSSTKYDAKEKDAYSSADRADGIARYYTPGNVAGTLANHVNFKMRIRRNNDGYVLTYLREKTDADKNTAKDADGSPEPEIIGQKVFYDNDRNNLTLIDQNNIYVGFVAARNADITISNISFRSIDPDDDDPATDREITEVRPDYQILSSSSANSAYYKMVFRSNADGVLNVVNKTDGNRVLAQNADIAANRNHTLECRLVSGENVLEWSFTPDKDYMPGQYEKLSSYDTVVRTLKVNYQTLRGDLIYVAPDGTNTANAGTAPENPLDIYTAVKYASAGQTIILAKGTYRMADIAQSAKRKNDFLIIERGHDGTAEAPIYMTAADDATGADRPVLDFTGQSTSKPAFTLAADHWYLKGFDVTGSGNGHAGIQLSGNYNVCEDLKTYRNGNTGVHICRYAGTDTREEWPSHNTLINCSSYLNADNGYEDADGFAAKGSVGEGNRFTGCIAAYNADDGWDLYAKVEYGTISPVTIENCVSFKNGYLLGSVQAADKSPLNGVAAIDETVRTEFIAGNGNGFKMGGENLSGYHVLRNSVSFGNRAKGIDSNSCPDIQIFQCTSFANEGSNVAFYTGTAVNTDYCAEGVLSIQKNGAVKDGIWVEGRIDGNGNAIAPDDDIIRLKGTQDLAKVHNQSNYYWSGDSAQNSLGHKASEDWFVSVDMAGAIFGNDSQPRISRKADGSIDMHGFLGLKTGMPEPAIPAGVGAAIGSAPADSDVEQKTVISVYAGTVAVLDDVILPASLKDQGYKWKYANTQVSVFAGTTSEFLVSAEGREDKAVTVNFVEVTGVKLTADRECLIGTSAAESENRITLTAIPVTVPALAADNIQGLAAFTYTITESDKLKLNVTKARDEAGKEKDNEVIVSRATDSGEGLAKFTAVMNVVINNKTIRKQTVHTFTTRSAACGFTYILEGAEETDNTILLNRAGDSFTLKDLKANNVGGNTTVKISTNDPKVLRISGTTVTAAGEGTATLTLTAFADKTVVKKISVTVRGTALKAGVSNITIDRALETGTQITLIAGYGEKPDGTVSVKRILKGKTTVDYAKYFDIEHLEGNIYRISVTDAGMAMPKGTYSMILQNTVTVGEGDTATTAATESEAFTVRVIETRPSVSLRQTKKVNLFYTAGSEGNSGKLTADCRLTGVTLKQTDEAWSDYRLEGTALTGYKIVLKQSAQDKTKRDLSKKITVDISFDGYKAYYDRKNVSIPVNTEEKAPKLKPEVDDRILYTQLGMTETRLRILNTTTNTYMTDAVVELTNAGSNRHFTLTGQKNAYLLSAAGSGSARISIQDPTWKKAVLASLPITVSKSLPKAAFAAVRLNSSPDYAGLEQADALITLKNASNFRVTELALDGTNAKTKALLEKDTEGVNKYLTYSVETDDSGRNVLRVSLKNKLPEDYAKGTYQFKARFTLSSGDGKVKLPEQTANVKVIFVPVATVTVSQKGRIDLIDRSGSFVSIKPTLRNLNGRIVGMELRDDASNQFDVTWDNANACAIVRAKEGIELKKGGRYRVTPVFRIQTHGGVTEIVPDKMLTITPKQSSLKTTPIPVLETRLSAPQAPAETSVKSISPAKAEILDMLQTNHTENFAVSYDAQSDMLTAKIVNTSGLKAGSTYKIIMTLNVRDAGVNVKKQTVTIPVKVLK